MTEEAKKIKAQYMREYRRKNRDRILEQERKRRADDPQRFKKYNERYWNKKANGSNED